MLSNLSIFSFKVSRFCISLKKTLWPLRYFKIIHPCLFVIHLSFPFFKILEFCFNLQIYIQIHIFFLNGYQASPIIWNVTLHNNKVHVFGSVFRILPGSHDIIPYFHFPLNPVYFYWILSIDFWTWARFFIFVK